MTCRKLKLSSRTEGKTDEEGMVTGADGTVKQAMTGEDALAKLAMTGEDMPLKQVTIEAEAAAAMTAEAVAAEVMTAEAAAAEAAAEVAEAMIRGENIDEDPGILIKFQ
jgi:hypothetical protein